MHVALKAQADDSALAERIAVEAGEALLRLREESESWALDDQADGAEGATARLRDEGDRIAQQLISDRLQRWRPQDLVLSEEAADDRRRLDADRVWIVDPLDGTREFAERTDGAWRDDWAVHVALWTRAAGLTAGAVAIPGRDQVFATGTPPVLPDAGPAGAQASAPPAERPPGRPLRLAVSRSHPAPIVEFLESRFPLELVPMGSAGVKAMAVVTGEVDGYVHDGGQYEWDSGAPVAVARAAGCVAHRLDGSELMYNQRDPWLPDLVICAPWASDEIDAMLRMRPQEKARTAR